MVDKKERKAQKKAFKKAKRKFVQPWKALTIISLVVTSAMPYPYFKQSSFLTPKQEQNINDFYEQEKEPEEVIPVPIIEVLNLDWFDTVNSFFEKYITTRVIDIYGAGGSSTPIT